MSKKDFYYQKETSEAHYTTTPTTAINVSRLLQNKPCWQQPFGGTLCAPKKIVLNIDIPFWRGKTTEERLIFAERLQELEKNGFELYVFCENHVNRLHFKTIKAFSTQLNEDTIDQQIILSEATKTLKISPDEILVLNPDKFKPLCDGDDEDWRQLKSIKQCDLQNSNITIDSLNHLFEQHSNEIEELDIRGCINLANGKLGNHLPCLTILKLGCFDDLSSLRKSLAFSSASDSSHDLTRVSGPFRLDTNLLKNDIKNLIIASKNKLRELVINGKFIDADDILSTVSSSDELLLLEILDFSNSNVTGKPLTALLEKAKNLKTLILRDISYRYIGFTFSNIALPELETLDVSNSGITSTSLNAILQKSTKLKTLILSGCNNITDAAFSNFDLPNLETLHAGGSNITSTLLNAILQKSTKLKTLILSDRNSIADDAFSGVDLPNLETLDVSTTNITGASLNALLKNSKNLKTLNLQNCRDTTDAAFSNFDLPNLETLNARYSNIPDALLNAILQKSKNIKTLNLEGCRDITDDAFLDVDLSKLEELSASASIITAELLSALSQGNTPNLKKLIIYQYVPSEQKKILLGEIEKKYPGIHIKTHLSPHLKLNIYNSSYTDDYPSHSSAQAAAPASQKSTQPVPSPPHTADAKKSLDADTTPDPKKTFNLNRIFFTSDGKNEPKPNDYRLSTFNQISPNRDKCKAENCFTLENKNNDAQFEKCDIKKSDKDLFKTLPILPADDFSHTYYAKKEIVLTHQWQALPSLSADETMLAYHVESNIPVQIQYSQRDNLYYIRSNATSPSPITIDFTVKVPNKIACAAHTLKEINELIKYCQNFTASSLDMSQKPDATGEDYLAALYVQKVGACRHRSAVFLWKMQEAHPKIPVRIVNNNCHNFVEIQIKGEWIAYNLGGYAAKLNINDTARPKAATEAAQAAQSVETIVTLNESGEIIPTKHYFESQQSTKQKPQTYLQSIVSAQNKTLLNVQTSEDIAGLRYHLEKYCHDTSRPYFYAHKPEDLICSSAYITRDEFNNGVTHQGPGGALHAFLEEHRHASPSPVIIINYDNFKSQDIVRFNAILDEIANADGTSLPANTKVIGLRNPLNPDAYTGSDFLSRFDHVDHAVPFSGDACKVPKIAESAIATQTHLIELYGGQDWENILLGSWELAGTQLKFVEGKLLKAFTDGHTHITLSNAPWDNDEFVSFWQKALLDKKIMIYGHEVLIPDHFSLSQKKGYDFSQKIKSIQAADDVINQTKYTLNPATLPDFFGRYHCTDAGLAKEKGILENHQNKTVSIYVSAEIPESTFAKLVDACQQYNVTLQLSIAKEVKLPAAFNYLTSNPTPAVPWKHDALPSTVYCCSTDVSTTTHNLKDAVIIDVSEMNTGDLLDKIDASFNEKTLSFSFAEKKGILLKLLAENKTVVLTGTFSDELKQRVTPFLLNRSQENKPSGRLLLVSSEKNCFPVIASYQHEVTSKEKSTALGEPIAVDAADYRLSQLQAIQQAKKRNPAGDAKTLLTEGLDKLPLMQKGSSTLDTLENIREQAQQFNDARYKKVKKALDGYPYVFLAGMSGVGKTTFVREVWKEKEIGKGALHEGISNIRAWTNDKTSGQKILFIDEANITGKQWSEFEGLFRDPPFIIIDNEKIDLTKEHKVIFAGNPLSYGGERQMPALFKNHGGNSVVFEPMTPAFIAHTMLIPALTSVTSTEKLLQTMKPIVDVAAYLTEIRGCKRKTPKFLMPSFS